MVRSRPEFGAGRKPPFARRFPCLPAGLRPRRSHPTRADPVGRGYQLGLRPAGKSQTIRIAWHPALPLPMFQCPTCERNCYRLHWRDEQWRSQISSGPLVHTSTSRNRMVPRLLCAPPELFTAIEPRPHNHRRYCRLAFELRQRSRRGSPAIWVPISTMDRTQK